MYSTQNDVVSQNLRAFLAIPINESLEVALTRLMHEMTSKPNGNAVYWQTTEKLHLTLRFFANLPSTIIPELLNALKQMIAILPPFEVKCAKLSLFPSSLHPRLIALEMEESLTLQTLATFCETLARDLGFPAESHLFRPHITLGRLGQKKWPTLTEISLINLPALLVNKLALYQSIMEHQRSFYKKIHTLYLS